MPWPPQVIAAPGRMCGLPQQRAQWPPVPSATSLCPPHRAVPTALHCTRCTAPYHPTRSLGACGEAHCAACPHLLVPTRGFCGMSMVLSTESCFTASPRSAMAQLSFLFTRMFLDFRSLCAIAGLPAHNKELLSVLVIAVQILV